MTCKTHNTPLHRNVFDGDRLYCPACAGERLLPDTPTQAPDYDLMGKYGGSNDSHLDDPAATAAVGFGWWKGV